MALSRSFDGESPARVIYHSHPNGQAYLSPTDREVATSPWGDGPAYPVQQLVIRRRGRIRGGRQVRGRGYLADPALQGFSLRAQFPGPLPEMGTASLASQEEFEFVAHTAAGS